MLNWLIRWNWFLPGDFNSYSQHISLISDWMLDPGCRPNFSPAWCLYVNYASRYAQYEAHNKAPFLHSLNVKWCVPQQWMSLHRSIKIHDTKCPNRGWVSLYRVGWALVFTARWLGTRSEGCEFEFRWHWRIVGFSFELDSIQHRTQTHNVSWNFRHKFATYMKG